MTKKNVFFLFSGQSRTSPFKKNKRKRCLEILNSYNKYIFTQEFKSKYNYQVFISTDDIHLSDTINYFSKVNIGNIHLLDTNYYYKNICSKIKDVSFYLNSYNKKDFGVCRKYDNSIYQHHKILDCYNMIRNSEQFDNVDYIVRLRLDIKINKDISSLITKLETNSNLQIILGWDKAAIGKPEIMDCYCTGLENNYGNYHYNVIIPKELPVMKDYHIKDKKRWTYAPERQLFEMLFEYCNNNNLDINNAISNEHDHRSKFAITMTRTAARGRARVASGRFRSDGSLLLRVRRHRRHVFLMLRPFHGLPRIF